MLPSIATKKQREAYKYAMAHPYSILAVDPRLGKSLVGIAIQQKLKENCLVICPGYLVSNWHKEIKKWAPPGTMVSTMKEGKRLYWPVESEFTVISFDLVQKAPYLFEWAKMILIDEGHHLKSMSAKRTQAIHKEIFENLIPRCHILTGTIIKNRVREFYSPMAIMHYDPNKEAVSGQQEFGSFIKKSFQVPKPPSFLDRFTDEIEFADYFSYREEFKVKIQPKRGKAYYMPVAKWSGLRRKEELKKYLRGHYLRIKASNKDLPPVTYKTVLISDSPNLNLLKAFNDHFETDGADSVRPDIKVEAAMKKVPFTIEYVEDLLTSVPCVLIYSDHVAPIEAIAAHFGVNAITGKMSNKKRAKIADDFQAGIGPPILCATIGALKEGRDLYRAKDMVLNDICWVPGDLKQVMNRMRGLGQKEPCTLHEIFGSPQDEKISKALKEKMEVIEQAT
jgi:SNF2 family DNA or RNA helicase